MGPRVAVILGTRPEIIKLAPVIARLGERAMVVHTGQHFDDTMSQAILAQFAGVTLAHHLAVGGLTRGAQIGRATEQIERVLLEHHVGTVLVQGDTNACLAGALAANAAGVRLVHLEAGMRSFDRSMPEEHNRVLTDALADLCLVPVEVNREQLLREGIPAERIRVVGSTLAEAARLLMPSTAARADLLAQLGLRASEFVLATVHRVENTDSPERLQAILEGLVAIEAPVVVPVHPRTRERIQAFGLGGVAAQLHCIDPLPYADFLALMAECALMISDSGGVQEESTIVRRPVLIVRTTTERPELLGTFAALVNPDDSPDHGLVAVARRVLADVPAAHAALASLPAPYADASAATVAAIDETS